MRFRAAHKLASYLLAGCAFAMLAATGHLAAPTIALVLGVGAASWWAEPGTTFGDLLERRRSVLTAAALVTFVLTLAQIVRSFPDPNLLPLLHLVLFLLGYKLLQRRGNRDYLQLYVLSFLLVLAAAWLADSALFAVGFAAFVVLATWTLILFHLRREIEDNYLVKHSGRAATEKVTVARVLDSRRVVGPAFFAATGLAAVGILVGSLAVFVFAPRIGVGFLTGGLRRHANVVGFTDDVQLGQHGVLSTDNDTVVLRVKLPSVAAIDDDDERDRVIAGLYWRGTVYDTYHEGHWARSRAPATATKLSLRPRAGGGRVALIGGPGDAGHEWKERALAASQRQEIEVVGLSHPVAFALDRPVALELVPTSGEGLLTLELEPRFSGETSLQLSRWTDNGQRVAVPDFSGARYVAYSAVALAGAVLGAGRPVGALPPEVLTPYLSVPASTSPRMQELATRLTAGLTSSAAKIVAITRWLQQTHAYTTDLQRNPDVADPLEDFVFHQKAGHCEYFASAAVILLRLSGVPARYVNGFVGGEWNDIGKHVTIRDNRAHSWAEAYLGEFGWKRVDATPTTLGRARMSRLRQLFDTVESFWSRWVLGYDMSRQLDLARRIAGGLGVRRPTAGKAPLPKPTGRQIGSIAAAAALGYVLVRVARRRRRSGGAAKPPAADALTVSRLYQRGLRALAARGLARGGSETAREFLARAAARGLAGEAHDALAKLTAAYERGRYGERPIDEASTAEMTRAIETLERWRPPQPVEPVARGA